MREFCFESINWSPYFGEERTGVLALVAAASQAGFAWISFDETLLEAARTSGITPTDLSSAVESAGLRTLAVHSLAITDDAEANLATAKPLIATAQALGAPYLHCGVGSPLDAKVRLSAQRVAACARESGVALAIEFLPFLPVASIADTRAVVEACDDESAGMVVDSWHFFHGPDGWEELAGLEASEIAYVQFDDHPALESDELLYETTQRRVLPGDGEFDLDRFAATLRRIGYGGVVGLELLSEESRARPPLDVAGELLERSRRYWD